MRTEVKRNGHEEMVQYHCGRIVGIAGTLAVTGCGGVSHKSPEKVTEELIQAYVGDKEKNVKDCYNQAG